jgi:hypothetical protein
VYRFLIHCTGPDAPASRSGAARTAESNIVWESWHVKGENSSICPKGISGQLTRHGQFCPSWHGEISREGIRDVGNATLPRLPEFLDWQGSLGIEFRPDFPEDLVVVNRSEVVSQLIAQTIEGRY